MAKVALLIDNDFEDMEALYPYYRLQEAGHTVIVIGPEHATYRSKHGYPLKSDKTPSEISIDEFKALIIPGGQAPDRMRTKPEMVGLVKKAFEKNLVVGSICHGAQMLIEANTLKGRRATCYISVKTDLINAGAMYLDSSVVIDGNLVTSREPKDLPDFGKTLIQMLAS